jgi:hypothetical protein
MQREKHYQPNKRLNPIGWRGNVTLDAQGRAKLSRPRPRGAAACCLAVRVAQLGPAGRGKVQVGQTSDAAVQSVRNCPCVITRCRQCWSTFSILTSNLNDTSVKQRQSETNATPIIQTVFQTHLNVHDTNKQVITASHTEQTAPARMNLMPLLGRSAQRSCSSNAVCCLTVLLHYKLSATSHQLYCTNPETEAVRKWRSSPREVKTALRYCASFIFTSPRKSIISMTLLRSATLILNNVYSV